MERAPSRVPRKQKPSRVAQERRRDLIEAAIRDIAANGYDKVTIATICEQAGFSRGLIGHYFVGKDELLLEAVRTVASELGQAIREAAEAAGPDPLDRLHGIVHASFTPPGFTPEKVAVWVSLTGSAQWSPDLAKIYRDIWRDYRRGVGRLMAKAAKERSLALDIDLTSLMFSQLIEGLWVGGSADPHAISAARAEACCHSFLEQTFGASGSLQGAGRPRKPDAATA
jgi:TetR/AcrR family transcriptional repressor of bet genes